MPVPGAEASSWQAHWQELVRRLMRVHSERSEQQLLERLAQPGEPLVLAFVNAHAMNSAAHSREFFEAVRSADVVLRDGIGMAILLRLMNLAPGLNLNGTDLIPKLLRRYDGQRIALFGTKEPYLSRARDALASSIAPESPCVTAHGFHDTAEYLRLAAEHRPDLIVLGMGMPRQEEVAGVLRESLDHPCLIVCGGAIIDFIGGKTSRAPRFVQLIGLEWAFRLAQEPRRLFKRYVIGNPLFLARAVQLAAVSPPPGPHAPVDQ